MSLVLMSTLDVGRIFKGIRVCLIESPGELLQISVSLDNSKNQGKFHGRGQDLKDYVSDIGHTSKKLTIPGP